MKWQASEDGVRRKDKKDVINDRKTTKSKPM